MSKFSANSLRALETCHPDHQMLFLQVVRDFDCSVICGYRGQEEQDGAFNANPQLSKVKWPNSDHNSLPSMAIDVIPYPTGYKDLNVMRFFVGYVLGVAAEMKRQGLLEHEVRNGIDWDNDRDLTDQTFIDIPHFWLVS